MNATYNLDHLQTITHITGALGATLGDAPALNGPRTTTTSHYDPTGKEVGTVSSTSYEGVTLGPDGGITGGTVSHVSAIPNGPKRSTTTIDFSANGKPVSAQITEHNITGEGDFKHTHMDLRGVTWNNSLAISAGQVKLTTTDAITSQKKHDGILNFDKEAVQDGTFTHYGPAGDKIEPGGDVVATGTTRAFYKDAKFLGAKIVGGQYGLYHQVAAPHSSHDAQVYVSPLGRTQSMEIENSDASNFLTGNVSADFSKVVFNARNEFHAGAIDYAAKDNKGVLLSQITVNYNNTMPALTTTLAYKNAQLHGKIVVDFTSSQFNNDHQVINSTKKVDVFSGANELLSSTIVTYDQYGNKVKQEPALPGAAPPKAPPVKAPAPAGFQAPPPYQSPLKAGGGDGSPKSEFVKRPDGTLELIRDTWFENNKPTSILITLIATDGETIIRMHALDLTNLKYDSGSKKLVGYVNMRTYFEDDVTQANSVIQY